MDRYEAIALARTLVVRVVEQRAVRAATLRTLATPAWKRLHQAADRQRPALEQHVAKAFATAKHGITTLVPGDHLGLEVQMDAVMRSFERALTDGLVPLLLQSLHAGGDAAAKNLVQSSLLKRAQAAAATKTLSYPRTAGGEGSGNFGHAGRPGEVGGSDTSGGSSIIEKLQSSVVKPSGDTLEGGANVSVPVTIEYSTKDNPDGLSAVYKPESGERWGGGFYNSDISQYITNRNFSLAEREAMAYETSQKLGIPLVPETVLREDIGSQIGSSQTPGDYDYRPDSQEQQEQYDSYRDKAMEKAMDDIGGEMGAKFHDAQNEHAQDMQNRADEVHSIWNSLIDKNPGNLAGTGADLRAHPNLPLGSNTPFQRRDPGVIDPLSILDKAQVDVSAPLNSSERSRVADLLQERLDAGHTILGDVNPSVARSHLTYEGWADAHRGTEDQMMEDKVMGFRQWQRQQGYDSDSGSAKNTQAPHPNGGSLQRLIENPDHYASISAEDGAKMAVLDYALGTMDRHGGNVLYKDNHPIAIDNGYSMPASETSDSFTFRSAPVQRWTEGSDTKVPESVRAPILKNLNSTDWNAHVAAHPSMNSKESGAFLGRITNLKEALQTDEGLADLWNNVNLIR